MMTTVQSKEECGKGPKKTFAPPAQKSHSLVPGSPGSSQEILRISSLDAKPRSNLTTAGVEMEQEEKAAPKSGPGNRQGKKRKTPGPKQAEKKGKEKSSISNEEFEEIVQIVLQKSFQNCLDTSCAQSKGCSQLDEEPEMVSSATNNNSADGARVMITHILEVSASQEGRLPKVKTPATDQPAPALSVKKADGPSSGRRKKEALGQDSKKLKGEGRQRRNETETPADLLHENENVEKTQSGPEHRQKDAPEDATQDHPQSRSHQGEEESGFGQCLVWVQCSSPNCEKWRRLQGHIDPSVLPDNWSCDQNTDLAYNRCDIPEETWMGQESDVAYASYIPGSIIWAKQYGYPWWPGMVEPDPDLREYFLFASHLDSLPSKYHVTFFGETVSRAWIPVNMMKNFQELSLDLCGVKKCKNKDCIQKLRAALTMAQKAEQIDIQARVGLFGFWSRYSGSDSTEDRRGTETYEVNSPNSSLERKEELELEEDEEEEAAVKEEEEKHKDPTLLSPSATKSQVKKPKARGGGYRNTADGRSGTLQKKVMKRPMENTPALAHEPLRKGQANSNPAQPVPKKKFKAPQSKPSKTNFSEEKEASVVSEGLLPPAHHEAYPIVEKPGPEPQEPAPQEAGSAPLDETSSDLDLDQLMEEVGKEPEQRQGTEDFTVDFSAE